MNFDEETFTDQCKSTTSGICCTNKWVNDSFLTVSGC